MNNAEKIEYFVIKCSAFNKENSLPLTIENIRRYFDFKFGKLPSESAIKKIYNKMANMGNNN